MQDEPCHSASGNAHVSWNGFFCLASHKLLQAVVETNRDFLNLRFFLSTLTPFNSCSLVTPSLDTEAKHD